MKKTVIFLAASAALSAGAAFAQYHNFPGDPDWRARDRSYDEWNWQHNRDERRLRDERVAQGWECWNPHAGHFVAVHPDKMQSNLDLSRCRLHGGELQPYPGYRGH